MRPFFFILLTSLFAACSTSPSEEQGTAVPDSSADVGLVEWTGYYEGTLPCADCPGIPTQLWVRSDSTFIMGRRYIDRGQLAFGTVGAWLVADGQLELYDRMHVIRRFAASNAGLEWLDEEGQPISSRVDHTLARPSGGASATYIPRMRLSGTFSYYADAMSFQPCGSTFSWPTAGGEQWTDEGKVLGSMNSADLQQLYLRSVSHGDDPWVIEVECTMAMGPAMEGDGSDEYIFIHRVLGTTQCP
jgi:uncharacterized lipoprotein NlpE involved in copper resistance